MIRNLFKTGIVVVSRRNQMIQIQRNFGIGDMITNFANSKIEKGKGYEPYFNIVSILFILHISMLFIYRETISRNVDTNDHG